MTMIITESGQLRTKYGAIKFVFELVIERQGHYFMHKDSVEEYNSTLFDILRNKGYAIYEGKNHYKICK